MKTLTFAEKRQQQIALRAHFWSVMGALEIEAISVQYPDGRCKKLNFPHFPKINRRAVLKAQREAAVRTQKYLAGQP